MNVYRRWRIRRLSAALAAQHAVNETYDRAMYMDTEDIVRAIAWHRELLTPDRDPPLPVGTLPRAIARRDATESVR